MPSTDRRLQKYGCALLLAPTFLFLLGVSRSIALSAAAGLVKGAEQEAAAVTEELKAL